MKYRICSLALGLLPLAFVVGCEKKAEEAPVVQEEATPAPETTEATTTEGAEAAQTEGAEATKTEGAATEAK